jgi:hypothetical protein
MICGRRGGAGEEIAMQICDDCRVLIGKPSSSEPHKSLRRSGVGMWGAVGPSGRREVKLHDRFLCSECGAWMYQCTEHDDETPNRWRTGGRPADWPKGLPTD